MGANMPIPGKSLRAAFSQTLLWDLEPRRQHRDCVMGPIVGDPLAPHFKGSAGPTAGRDQNRSICWAQSTGIPRRIWMTS